jgi:hypothetical protein
VVNYKMLNVKRRICLSFLMIFRHNASYADYLSEDSETEPHKIKLVFYYLSQSKKNKLC